jgi:hypothetical protein
MGLEVIWNQITIVLSQVWIQAQYELGGHPYLLVGGVVVVILAWRLYKTEIRHK